MDKKSVLEAVSAAGVIASLVFVGLEVRQSAEATRAATVLQLKEGWAELNMVQMGNPEVIDALLLATQRGLDDIDPRSQLIVSAWGRTLMHNWSNAFYQYRAGTLDDEQWRALLRDMEGTSRFRVYWEVWDASGHIYDDSFRNLMDSLRVANYDPDASLVPPGLPGSQSEAASDSVERR